MILLTNLLSTGMSLSFPELKKFIFEWPVGTGVTESRKEVTAEIKCQLEIVSHPYVLRIYLAVPSWAAFQVFVQP